VDDHGGGRMTRAAFVPGKGGVGASLVMPLAINRANAVSSTRSSGNPIARASSRAAGLSFSPYCGRLPAAARRAPICITAAVPIADSRVCALSALGRAGKRARR
jgi:hypothetical protein